MQSLSQATIIDAADRLFSRLGFAKVTMDEIGIEASLKKASLYYYFATKEELFRAVVNKRRSEFRAQVEQLLASKATAHRQLEQYVMLRFDYFRALQELNILDFKQRSGNVPTLIAMFKRHAAEELRWLTMLLDRGQRENEFLFASPRKTAEIFLHALQGLRLRFMREGGTQDPGQSAFTRLHREMTMFAEIFLTGIQIPAKRQTRDAR